jgi:hypothetical protein
MRRARRSRGIAAGLLAGCLATGCTQVVRYSESLVSDPDRTLLTRLPATVGGTAGFVIGIPIDIAAVVPLWLFYRSQPQETRDPLSVFLFPSFVLWKMGALLGAPFDVVEWATWRGWQPAKPLTQEEREAIERDWDSRLSFPEFPVTPIYPAPASPPTPTGGR